ncbi:PRDM8 protein, partial [Amia calva]|nr:PRDM8 protein [Amia calva]
SMQLSFSPRSLWAADSKCVHHSASDLLASVHVTRDIPGGACFGPCVLQNTFYDTIAFIALKSLDRRSKSYVFRVDAEAMKNSPNALSWLRLVQAASNQQEQNMEAYLKNAQLYFRCTRPIRKDEELLVWYNEELSHLLGFSEIKTRTMADGFKCIKCDQVFKNEHPYLAHCRFLCVQGKHDLHGRDFQPQKAIEIKGMRRVTDFHNIARDLEHKKPTVNEDANTSSHRKRKNDDAECPRARKTVLLEKTNISNDNNIIFMNRDGQGVVPELAASVVKLGDKYLFKRDISERKHSAFTETGHGHLETDSVIHSTGSAFSFVLPKAGREEQKSAFCKPSKRTVNIASMHPSHALSSTERLGDVLDTITRNTISGYRSLLGSKLLTADVANSQTLQTMLGRNGSFPYASEPWPRHVGGQLQTSSSLTLLPPSFTSFGVAVQNWCAKCNLSFRMTSDLVFHMRSHHKKEFAAESQVQRRREEKLTCPICHEYFRERHHLSRHMTSHN